MLNGTVVGTGILGHLTKKKLNWQHNWFALSGTYLHSFQSFLSKIIYHYPGVGMASTYAPSSTVVTPGAGAEVI